MKITENRRWIAIVPSRGGSTRIPKKSLKVVGNRSMLGHSINTAQKATIFSKIYVNTDSPAIGEAATALGAEVPFLRDKYADNHTPVSTATIHFITQLISSGLISGDEYVAQMMPNCPFLTPETVKGLLGSEKLTNNSSVLSAIKLDPLSRFAFEFGDHGQHKRVFKDTGGNERTQDFKQLFIPSGAIWAASINYLMQYGTFYGANQFFEAIPELEGFDIDTLDQLDMARIIEKGRR